MYEQEPEQPVSKHKFAARFFQKAPWWIISASITLTILGLSSIAHFYVIKETEKGAKGVEASVALDTAKIDLPEEEREIESEPIPLLEPDDSVDPLDTAEPDIFIPEAKISR